jgi:hypothetical protein
MAVVTRYFGVTSAGAGDGTTYANRAELFSGGAWSSVITGFNFTADSLVARIAPGTYACSQSLASGLFANPPTAANPLILHGSDSSGNMLEPTQPDWVSAQPATWDSGLPLIETTTNITTINLATAHCRLIAFLSTGVGGTGGVINNAASGDWIAVTNSTNATNATGISASAPNLSNVVVRMTGDSYSAGVIGSAYRRNIRIEGVTGSSGNRRGYQNLTLSTPAVGLTIIGCPGGAFNSSTSTASSINMLSCTLVNCGTGITGSSGVGITSSSRIARCFIANNSGFGIDAQTTPLLVTACRLRNNTSGNFTNFGNYPTDIYNFTAVGSDAAEFVNAAAGDYRIKYGSEYWGLGIGAGDEPAPAGGLGFNRSMLGGFRE